jgi:hypothetical protein
LSADFTATHYIASRAFVFSEKITEFGCRMIEIRRSPFWRQFLIAFARRVGAVL